MKIQYKFNSVSGWQKNSFIDFPGTVSTVLFFSNCNLRCPYCHNPDIVLNKLNPINSDDFWSFLEKRKNQIGGVVLTGGEPTICKDLFEIITTIKYCGYKIKLDTNGLLPEVIEKVVHLVDYVAIDVKTSSKFYKEKLGYQFNDALDRIIETINVLLVAKKESEFRVTAVKDLIDTSICHEISKTVKGMSIGFIQQLNYKTKMLDPIINQHYQFTKDELEQYRQIFLTYVNECKMR